MILPAWSDRAIDPPPVGWRQQAKPAPVRHWRDAVVGAPVDTWSITFSFTPTLWLYPPLLSNSQAFYGPSLTASISPALLANAPLFFSPITTQNIAAPLASNANSFYAPSVAFPIHAPFVVNSAAIYSPAVTAFVSVPLVTNSASIFTLSTTQDIAPALLANTASFYAPTVNGSPVKTYIGSTASASDLTTYTFTDHAIGAAASDRLVVVVVHLSAAASRTLSSLTIGGNSATINGTTNVGSGSGVLTAIAYLQVTSGTTATIVVTASGGCLGCQIDVYSLTNLSSQTPQDADLAAVGSGPRSLTSTTTANGVVIAGATSTTTHDFSWTGPTEDAESTVSGVSCGSASIIATGTSQSVSVTSASGNIRLAACSWI